MPFRDLERGTLIGEQTFGKGSVQQQFQLTDGSLLRVTSASWFTPDGHTINGIGISPDLLVAPSEDDSIDAQLDAAIEFLLDQLAVSGT